MLNVLTLSSCFYIINSKYNHLQYIEWMNNFISIVNQFYLVIYTDENTIKYIDTKHNPNIKVIIKPLNQFYNYKYKLRWIENHKKNSLLNDKSSWELNMLWAEKISFVKETIERKYFNTEFYGWCDIGYFRNRVGLDTNINELMRWPDNHKINGLDKNKIIYACVNCNDKYLNDLINIIKNKNSKGLPKTPIPPKQVSLAGGFFILHKSRIDWWFHTFDAKLSLYFNNHYLVKDDQIIIADCVFSELHNFELIREYKPPYDNWFVFQRYFI